MRGENIIPVNVGDLVRAVFKHYSPIKTVTVRVEETIKHYGKINGKKPDGSVLVIGTNVDTQGEESFDSHFVTEVLEHSKFRPGNNIYSEKSVIEHAQRSVEKKGSTWTGRLRDMAILALGGLPYELDRPLNMERLFQLYFIQGWGLKAQPIDHWPSYCVVNSKRFKAWIHKNYSRILQTVGEIEARETRIQQQFEKDYWASVRREEDREMDRMFGPDLESEKESFEEDNFMNWVKYSHDESVVK